MDKTNIKKRANAALAFSGAGILAAFPFQQTFMGGLLFSAFSAATIGGLADSFAVSALFGNPLRIHWPRWMGTRIISRNRERLIGELVAMVEQELLTIPNIRERLAEYDISAVITTYLRDQGGTREVNAILQQLAADIIAKVDANELAEAVQQFLLDHADMLQVSDIIADIGDWTLKHGYDERVAQFLVQQLIKLAESEQFRIMIEQIAQSAIKSYEGDKLGRRLVDFTAGMNAYSISNKIQAWIISFLGQFSEPDHPLRERLNDLIVQFIQRLRSDEPLRERMEQGKLKLIHSIKDHIHIDEFLKERLLELRAAVAASADTEDKLPWMTRKVEETISQFVQNRSALEQMDQTVKSWLMNWIEQKHSFIGRTVQDKLNQFSEEELIELVKDKAGHDLQFIRLNGIVVGALIGAVLYLSTFWIGGA